MKEEELPLILSLLSKLKKTRWVAEQNFISTQARATTQENQIGIKSSIITRNPPNHPEEIRLVLKTLENVRVRERQRLCFGDQECPHMC